MIYTVRTDQARLYDLAIDSKEQHPIVEGPSFLRLTNIAREHNEANGTLVADVYAGDPDELENEENIEQLRGMGYMQ